MPCLNEAETVATCVDKAQRFLKRFGVNGEVVVGDNGSTDGSIQIAEQHGARVVHVLEKGYGSALMGGIEAAQGRFIIMGDSDDSHDLDNLDGFVKELRNGVELVVGNRFSGGIAPGAMSFMNRYIGNPILSGIGRIFFHSAAKDFHCGLRGFSRDTYNKLDLRTKGMEFASEMIVKASLMGMRISEVPTTMFPAGRSRSPHLRPFRDGWRHLRFLMLYSPRWLFLYPGIFLILLGLLLGLLILPGTLSTLDIHPLLYAVALLTIGFQAVSFAILSKIYAVQEHLLPEHEKLKKLLKKVSLEKGLIIGAIMVLLGVGGFLYALYLLEYGTFGMLGTRTTMRIVIPSVAMLELGFQVIFSSFFYSILKLKTK